MVEYANTNKQLLYNLIIRRETLRKLMSVLELKNSMIEINGVILPIQSLSAIQDPQYIMNIHRKLSGKAYSLQSRCK